MNKLPFFKFDAASWLTGNITLLSLTEQAVFINLCALIWRDGGEYKIEPLLERRLGIPMAEVSKTIGVLCDANLLLCKDDVLSVKFLTEQLQAHAEFKAKKAASGRKGAERRWQGMAKKKEERREKKDPPLPPKGVSASGESGRMMKAYAGFRDTLYRTTTNLIRQSSKWLPHFNDAEADGITLKRLQAITSQPDAVRRHMDGDSFTLDTPGKFFSRFAELERAMGTHKEPDAMDILYEADQRRFAALDAKRQEENA
jgi:hypothetical protein